ncbi:VWA domain-containing protein [Nocardiopsis sp. ARC36]
MNAQSNGNLAYAVDIVLCVDVTASMGPVLEKVKKSALGFHSRLSTVMGQKSKAISQLRLRIVAFRDFADNPDDAIESTEFLTFPEQEGDYESFVQGLEPVGGGDIPESGLEALALAIRSPWETGLDRRRHVIVLFTDASAHPLGDPDATSVQGYPADIPAPWTTCSRSGATPAAKPPVWTTRPSAWCSSPRTWSRGPRSPRSGT